jgi:esterase/lipase superfamily enzyme
MRRFTSSPWRTGFRGLFPAGVRASSPRHLLAVAITVFGLTGCAAPKGVLEPVANSAPPGTTQVEELVATTRVRTTPAEMFSGERGQALDFADIVVSIPPVHQPGNVEWPHQIPGNPETDFVTLEPTRAIDKTQAAAVFRRLLRKGPTRHVLVFVHGYNNRFEAAVFRFAQFIHDSDARVVPILFTWPSKGKLNAYGYDHESANYSRDALEQGLRFLVKDPEVSEISILAHSMGNWLTLEALRQMAIRDGKVAGKIHNVVLADADVDVQVAYKQIDQIDALGARRPNFTLVTSEDDKALAISRKFWGEPRLGSIDPDQERTNLKREGIVAINATTYRSLDPVGHSKIFANPELARIIGRTLTADQTLTDPSASIGEKFTRATAGLTASVGQAAGAVVSAPLAIVDPDTRENYGDQIDAFGQSVRDAATPQ